MSLTPLPTPVADVADLRIAAAAFMDTPELWRPAIGGGGRYFVHVPRKAGSHFGLSKFCYFKGISLPEYVGGLRHEVGGGARAQKHIVRITRRHWTPLKRLNHDVRVAFLEWWKRVFPEGRSTARIGVLTLDGLSRERLKAPPIISPAVLAKRLEAQAMLGVVGEKIAIAHETLRLQGFGVQNANRFIDHVSLHNVAAGYDLWSHAPKIEERFVEVKAMSGASTRFFMTRHEVEVLRALGDAAFLYLVKVSDAAAGIGKVVQEIRNPVGALEASASLTPTVFEVVLDARDVRYAG